jgi:hypothetical protein
MAGKVTFIRHKPSPFTKATIKARLNLDELVARWPDFRDGLTSQDLGHILTTLVRIDGKTARLLKLVETEATRRGLRLVGGRKTILATR